MQNASENGKIIVLILAMMLLIYGVQNVSYGQVAPTVEAGKDDTKHKHDGFYLRLTTGVGSTTSVEETEVGELSFSGMSGNTTLGTVGYAVVENLIINLDIFASSVTDPTVEIDGKDVGAVDAEVTITNIGVGGTYYIMPANLYLGSIGLATGSVGSGRVKVETDTGYGINVAIGKEWWVSDNWGIGVAGQLFHTVLPDENLITGEVYDLKTTSFGILFSATSINRIFQTGSKENTLVVVSENALRRAMNCATTNSSA